MPQDRREAQFTRATDEMKDFRLDHPSGWLYLTRHQGVQLMIDALLDAGSEREFNKSELADFAGVSRQTVQNRIERLLELGILRKVDRGSTTRYRYNPNSDVSQAIIELNKAVNATQIEKAESDSEEEEDEIPTIDWQDKDVHGRSVSSKKRDQMYRLRKWQERIRTKNSNERNLQFAIDEIDRMASALGVPRSVHEVSSVIYRRALKEDLVRDRSIEAVATAALYVACRKEGIPRSLEEISEVSRVERKEIDRTYRYISQELGLETEPVDPKKYVPRFCSELGLSEEVQTKANEIIEMTAEEGLLSGNSPTGYAAAAIYAASLLCNEKRTQREVADVAQVTEVTIRNRYQEQIEAMGMD